MRIKRSKIKESARGVLRGDQELAMKLKVNALFVLMVMCALPAQAKLYKWVDEEGQVHFGDSIPMQYRVREHMEMNEQGATVKKHAAQETKEERLEKLRLEQLRKEEEAKIAEREKKDRGLLDTYTTERDLIAARDARLDAVASQLQLSESIINDTQRKLDVTNRQIAQIKASGRVVPKNISDKLKHEQEQLVTYKKVAAGHLEKERNIHKQFDGFIERFRMLKAEQRRKKELRDEQRRKELGLDEDVDKKEQ